jgi:hypothetical protein
MDKLVQRYLTEIEKLLNCDNDSLNLETLNQIERILRRFYVDACLLNNYEKYEPSD